jgi:hypothetical protein
MYWYYNTIKINNTHTHTHAHIYIKSPNIFKINNTFLNNLMANIVYENGKKWHMLKLFQEWGKEGGDKGEWWRGESNYDKL